jgi:anti-anti-sigma regulatory factor
VPHARVVGPVDSHLGFGLHDHFCWVPEDQADYRARLAEFLAEGLGHGLRVVYVGSGTAEGLREHLSGIGDVGALLARDAMRIVSVDEVYGSGTPVDPAEVIRRFAAETDEALADGYRGLRASADVTDVVRTAEQQDAFCRYEFLIDRYLSRHPLSGMCAYSAELGVAAVQRFAALHPAASAGLTPFHVFACHDGAVGLAGEIELAWLPELERALEHLSLAAVDGKVIVDLSRVEFVDHQALLALAAFAERSEAPVTFSALPAIARRIASLLGIARLDGR